MTLTIFNFFEFGSYITISEFCVKLIDEFKFIKFNSSWDQYFFRTLVSIIIFSNISSMPYLVVMSF